MRKSDIIKHIRGESSLEENQNIIDWINKDPRNLKYYSALKNLWINSTMPRTEASYEEMGFVQQIINNQGNKKHFVFYSAVATIIILLTTNIFLLFNNKIDIERISTDKMGALTNTLFTNKGVKAKVELPDGSIVWLNSASMIKYPAKFMGVSREVYISGEALFDVVHDSLRPMIVSTNKNFKIEVLGTKFNVRCYDDDNDAQTTLLSGSIKLIHFNIKTGKDEITNLLPTESFLLKNNHECILINKADTTKQKAWKEGWLIFDNTPMSDVLKKLQRWHGVNFILDDKKVLNYKFTAEFNSESIIQILEMIKYCSFIDYKIDGSKIHLFIKKYKTPLI